MYKSKLIVGMLCIEKTRSRRTTVYILPYPPSPKNLDKLIHIHCILNILLQVHVCLCTCAEGNSEGLHVHKNSPFLRSSELTVPLLLPAAIQFSAHVSTLVVPVHVWAWTVQHLCYIQCYTLHKYRYCMYMCILDVLLTWFTTSETRCFMCIHPYLPTVSVSFWLPINVPPSSLGILITYICTYSSYTSCKCCMLFSQARLNDHHI